MMCWACLSRTKWRSVPRSFGEWAVGRTVMWAGACCWAFFSPSGACDGLSPGVCWCCCFGGGGPRPVQGDGVFPGPSGQDVDAWVAQNGAQVHVAFYGGVRERLAQGRGAWGGTGRVVVLTSGVVDAVWGDVYGKGSNGGLWLMRLDVIEARRHPCVGVPLADSQGVCP